MKFAFLPMLLALTSCNPEDPMPGPIPELKPDQAPTAETETATFAGGCFWCTEAVFLNIKGVKKVVSGYSGGTVKNPTYEQICTGKTGHAEVIQITYDPKVVRFEKLLEAFWTTHDPTTLNRQGNDIGTQYRSAVFYHDEQQKAVAEKYKKLIDESKAWPKPLVTEIVKFDVMYPAEDYHQNYFAKNPTNGYCQVMIPGKIEKLKKIFKD